MERYEQNKRRNNIIIKGETHDKENEESLIFL